MHHIASSNKADDVLLTPNNYTLISQINRPKPTDYMFYDYPAFTKTNDGRYLVIVTESYFDGTNEYADLHQFTIK
jgi:hypothetical protein